MAEAVGSDLSLAPASENTVTSELKLASFSFLEFTKDLLDSFAVSLNESDEKDNAMKVVDQFNDFLESKPEFVSARARSERFEDRVKILPGQHPGIGLQFKNDNNQILRINFYGGLRGFISADFGDKRSNRINNTSSNVKTEQILSQPTEINFHIKDSTNNTTSQMWAQYNMNRDFILKTMSLDGTKIDAQVTLTQKTYGFDKLKTMLHSSASKLVDNVPYT